VEGSVLFVSTESTAAFMAAGFYVCLQRASLAFTFLKTSSGVRPSVNVLVVPFLIAPLVKRGKR
jgi:hypothetical protein